MGGIVARFDVGSLFYIIDIIAFRFLLVVFQFDQSSEYVRDPFWRFVRPCATAGVAEIT